MVTIPVNGVTLEGSLAVPNGPRGIVLLVSPTGSSRFNEGSLSVAVGLQQAGFATIVLDLLTPHEQFMDTADGREKDDVRRLARRLMAATVWTVVHPLTRALGLGYLGFGSGAAAALMAASKLGPSVSAVVSCGGRPDLAGHYVGLAKSPTLLIVGESDKELMDYNRASIGRLKGEKQLAVIPEEKNMFEEPAALRSICALAADWFRRFLRSRRSHPTGTK